MLENRSDGKAQASKQASWRPRISPARGRRAGPGARGSPAGLGAEVLPAELPLAGPLAGNTREGTDLAGSVYPSLPRRSWVVSVCPGCWAAAGSRQPSGSLLSPSMCDVDVAAQPCQVH